MNDNINSIPNLMLLEIFSKLYSFYGPQNWWPAESSFEVAIGAILTQNISWENAKRAIENLKRENLLNPKALREIPIKRLSELIKPSGYYNIKSKKIKAFVDFVYEYSNGNLEKFKDINIDLLRSLLLSVYGIGPETADSILLYSLEKPIFVVDIYTKRVFSRHNLINHEATYDEIQRLVHSKLQRDSKLYNEYHALLVKVGKDYCKPKPICKRCPLNGI
ncbi:MAG: hypothetical protein N2511_01445 [Thermodesulfovibrionales bacterium]|nr:hypothetical protein [Thermodesulfovibrionales bacterium]